MRAPSCATGPTCRHPKTSIVAHACHWRNRTRPWAPSKAPIVRDTGRGIAGGATLLGLGACGRGGGAGMCEGQPARESFGRLVRGRAVERHHRRRDAWNPAELGPPMVAHWRDVDLIDASVDDFFETMLCHVLVRERLGMGQSILFAGSVGSSEAGHEGVAHRTPSRPFHRIGFDKNLRCRPVNSFCTVHPQLFHTGVTMQAVRRPGGTLQYRLPSR